MNIPFAKFLSILTGFLFKSRARAIVPGLAGDVPGGETGHVPRDPECWLHQNENF